MKIRSRNAKYTSIIIATFAIGLIMLSPITVLPNVSAQNAKIMSESVADGLIKKYHPKELSKTQLDMVKNMALSDSRVKQIINGKPYEFMSQAFIGNIKENPSIWNPYVNINVNNQTNVIVEVNLNNGSVISVESTKLAKSSTSAAFALDKFTGSATYSGLYATLTAPSVTTFPNVRFLVNGFESGGSLSGACNSAFKYNDYFGQGGFDFSVRRVMYSDTSFNCVNQYPPTSKIAYTSSDPYLFEVYSSSGPKWNVIGSDLVNGQSFTYTTSFTTSASTLQNSDDTSVWFENQETTTNWASGFTSSITANNAHYDAYPSGPWTQWNSDAQKVLDCSNNQQTQNVMNNNLINTNTQTWNLANFEVWHC